MIWKHESLFYNCVKSLHDSKWAKIKTVVSDAMHVARLNQSHIWVKTQIRFLKKNILHAS